MIEALMPSPEQFDIIQRAGTPQCRIRILFQRPDNKTMYPSGHFIYLTYSRMNEPIHTVATAAWLAINIAHDLFGLQFAWDVRDSFIRRRILADASFPPKETKP